MLVCMKSDYNNQSNSINMTSQTVDNVEVHPHKSTRRVRPLRKHKHENRWQLDQGSSTTNENGHLTNGFEKHENDSEHLNHPHKEDLKPLKVYKQNSESLNSSDKVVKSEKDRALDYSRHLLNRNFHIEKNDSASEFVKAIISAVDDMNDHNISHKKLLPKHEEKVHGAKKHVKHKSTDQSKKKTSAHKSTKDTNKNLIESNACNGDKNNNIEPSHKQFNDTNTNNLENNSSKNNENTKKHDQGISEHKQPLSNGILLNIRPVPSPKTNRRLLNSKRILNQVPENESSYENQASSKYSSLIRYLNNVPEHEHHEEQNHQDDESKLNNLSDTNEVNESLKNNSLDVFSHENSQNSSEKSNREDIHGGIESNWQPAVTDSRNTDESLDADKTSQHVPLMFQRRRRSRNEEYCRVRSSDGKPLTASEMRYYRRRPIISPADSRSTNTSIDEDSNNSRTRRRRPVQPWHHLQSDSDSALQRRMLHNAIQQKAASVRILIVLSTLLSGTLVSSSNEIENWCLKKLI